MDAEEEDALHYEMEEEEKKVMSAVVVSAIGREQSPTNFISD